MFFVHILSNDVFAEAPALCWSRTWETRIVFVSLYVTQNNCLHKTTWNIWRHMVAESLQSLQKQLHFFFGSNVVYLRYQTKTL